MSMLSQQVRNKRKEAFDSILNAFAEKYGWLGAQTARELLLSAATWNIQKYSEPPFRYRTHTMLAWKRGWVKTTLLTKMGDILGDEIVSTCGKVTGAALRGSTSGSSFNPPKPLRTPIMISTEFGETSFDEELLNHFLALLEEGTTNVAMNKLGSIGVELRKNIEQRFDGGIEFKENNEYNLNTDFVFWGATYDPSKLQDDALRSRFNIVTPSQPLSGELTKRMDNTPPLKSYLDKETVRTVRREILKEEPVETDFSPPDAVYDEYNLNPRESRDTHSYMAALNWWGIDITPQVMKDYIKQMKESRRKATMTPAEQVFNFIFEDPHTFTEIEEQTGYSRQEVYRHLEEMDASKCGERDGEYLYTIRTGATVGGGDTNDDEEDTFLGEKLES